MTWIYFIFISVSGAHNVILTGADILVDTCVQVWLFQGITLNHQIILQWWDLSYPRTLSAWPSLLITIPKLFLYWRVCFYSFGMSFQLRHWEENSCLNNLFTFFLDKTSFSILITHYSVNFTWFSLLNH